MFILYFCLFILSIFLVSRRDVNFATSLSPTLLLLAMMFLYTIFGALFILDKTTNRDIYLNYWGIQFLSLTGVIFSIIVNKFNLRISLNRQIPTFKVKLIFSLLVVFHSIIYVNKYGGLKSILATGYSLVYENEETNLIYFSILGMLAAFSIRFKMHKLIFISSLIFFLIAIMLGTRGIAIAFFSIPIMSYYLNNQRFSYKKVVLFSPLFIFFLIVAYIRNIGFSNIGILLSLDYDFYYSLFIKNSEFNTAGLVIFTGLSNPNWYENNFFEYFYGIIAAIIPKGLWPSRPDAISNIFSFKFAPPGEGIGFNIGYESYILIGTLGPVLYFYCLQKIIQKLYCSKKFYINALILFCPLLIMWVNRIDLQTILKVSLIYLFYCYLWKLFIKIIV